MAELSYSCDVSQGFNFQKDAQPLVGFINAIDIGEKGELLSDFTVTDPEDNTATIKVAGIVSNIYWAGGYADPVQFSCQVSNDNAKTLAILAHTSLSSTDVAFSFTIYDYDPVEKNYYQCFHTDGADLNGLILKSGGSLEMHIDQDQSMEVVSPKNYAFNLGVMPQEEAAQEIHVAVSVTDKFVKQWGIEVSG